MELHAPTHGLLPPLNKYSFFLPSHHKDKIISGFLVSKETVVLRRWEKSKQKFGIIKQVDFER